MGSRLRPSSHFSGDMEILKKGLSNQLILRKRRKRARSKLQLPKGTSDSLAYDNSAPGGGRRVGVREVQRRLN